MAEAGDKSPSKNGDDDSPRDPSPQQSSSEIDAPRFRGRNKDTPGILRIDSTSRSPRYSIAAPFLTPQADPSSPQPSVDRLSVTFAEPSVGDSQEVVFRDQKTQLQFVIAPISPLENNREFEMRRVAAIAAIADSEEAGDEDDYSASASAIIQRRASFRRPSRKKRRSSSPFNQDADGTRRRSSAFTTSSGDTAISIEEGGTQEQIFENLKLHKEVLGGVRQQPWPLRRKIKLVQQAKSYVRRHEGALQERLAQNRSTRDVIARASILINKNLQYFRRELVNLQTWLIPWERRIKQIESHFGSAVASYFIFLRWLFWVNLVITAIIAAFVTVPEMLTSNSKLAGERKTMLPGEKAKSTHLLTIWEFEGVLKYSPFFYGWYSNRDSGNGYRLPLAYFLVNLVVYIYSFVVILRKMAENSRMSKLSEKEDECAFTWKLFTGWDFMIGNPETAHNRTASIVLGFKEALLEEAEKQKVERNWKLTIVRVFVNLAVVGLLALSAFAVVQVVSRSAKIEAEIEAEPKKDTNWWRQSEITIVMSSISFVFPMFFDILGYFENYHPRKQLRFQLARITMLNLLNIYSLIIALFGKIGTMTRKLEGLKPKSADPEIEWNCTTLPVSCVNFTTSLSKIIPCGILLMTNITSQTTPTTPGLSPSEISPSVDPVLGNRPAFQILDPITRPTRRTTTTTEFDEDYYELYNYGYDDDVPKPDGEELTTFSTNDDDESTSSSTSYGSSSEMYNFSDPSTTYSSSETYEISTDATYTTTMNPSSSFDDVEVFSDSSTEFTSETTEESITDRQTTNDFNSETTRGSMAATNLTTTGPVVEHVIVNCYNQYCEMIKPPPEEKKSNVFQNVPLKLETRKALRRLCWETMFGQELTKLTVMDLAVTTVSTLGMDFFRAVFIRHMNNCWCWDLEKQFPQYGDFKIAENILHLVNNQGMVWMGMFFSPGLIALNVVKIGFLMYLRSWAVMTCNVPHEVVFRASRSNNFYLALLLTMLFLCVLPVGYAIVWVEPSWHCGPFSGYHRMYRIATESLKNALPSFERILDYIASPGIVIPLIVLMALIIYYMVSLTGSLREANNDLKIQLRQERTEERRKMFKIAEKRQDIHEAPFVKWKKILPVLPSSKSAMVVIDKGTATNITLQQRKELRKQSAASEAGEATDGEQESLPHDPATVPAKEVAVDVVPRNRRLIKQIKNRSYSSGSVKEGDSLGSQCSDYGVIPKIRISGTEGIAEVQHHASPGKTSVTSMEGGESSKSPKASESKHEPE